MKAQWFTSKCVLRLFLCSVMFNCCYTNTCQNGWTQGTKPDNIHCYKFIPTKDTIDAAIARCANLSAVLPIFDNKEQFLKFTKNTLPLIFPVDKPVFMGYVRKIGTNTFLQIDGTTPPYPLVWSIDQPSGYGANGQPGNCAVAGGLYGQNSLDDDSCSNPGHHVVCQYEIDKTMEDGEDTNKIPNSKIKGLPFNTGIMAATKTGLIVTSFFIIGLLN